MPGLNGRPDTRADRSVLVLAHSRSFRLVVIMLTVADDLSTAWVSLIQCFMAKIQWSFEAWVRADEVILNGYCWDYVPELHSEIFQNGAI